MREAAGNEELILVFAGKFDGDVSAESRGAAPDV